MPTPTLRPSDDDLRRLVEAGKTNTEIADWVEAARGQRPRPSTVAVWRHRAGLSHRTRHEDLIPWSPLKSAHQNHYAVRMLRLEAKRRTQGEEALRRTDLQRLTTWKRDLAEADAVVHYVPQTTQGFYYVPRRPKIDTDLIRIPTFNLTPTQRTLLEHR